MSENHSSLPTSAGPDALRICETCVVGDPETERYFFPLNTYILHIRQALPPRNRRVGTVTTKVSLLSRQDVVITNPDTDQSTTYEDVLVNTACDEVDNLTVTPETWNTIKEVGCPGPDIGRKKYLLFGPRNVTCGLINYLHSQAIEPTDS